MTKIIDGKKIARSIKDQVVKDVESLCSATKMIERRPSLAIVLVGNREDSELYVSMKEKEAKKVGIDTHTYRCDVDTPELEILNTIKFLNNDDSVDAILVQLPLPDHFDTDKIIKAIKPEKDVDRFHPENLKILLNSCNHNEVMPPVFSAVLKMLQSIDFKIENSKACIVAKSDIFGKSLAKVLECKKSNATITSPEKSDFKRNIKEADLLISIIGKKDLINGEDIKKGAVLIDVGISKDGKKVCGDIDFESVDDVASYVTPVPGGVGPMTIACLFQNVVKLYKGTVAKHHHG